MWTTRKALLAGLVAIGLGPSAEAQPRDVWVGRVVAKIRGAVRLPPAAKGMTEDRRAVVRFTLDRTGRIGDPAVDASTGDAGLDKAALDAVRAADPLPPPPFPLPPGAMSIVLRAPIRFGPGSARSLGRAQRAIGGVCTGC